MKGVFFFFAPHSLSPSPSPSLSYRRAHVVSSLVGILCHFHLCTVDLVCLRFLLLFLHLERWSERRHATTVELLYYIFEYILVQVSETKRVLKRKCFGSMAQNTLKVLLLFLFLCSCMKDTLLAVQHRNALLKEKERKEREEKEKREKELSDARKRDDVNHDPLLHRVESPVKK